MIKTAVIGVGYLGTYHAEKYFRSQEADLVAIVDSNEKRAKKIARKYKAVVVPSIDELPGLGVEAASIACDTSAHYAVAANLLKNGIDILLEKPMTTTIADAKELIALAEANSRILQVGHLERFNPAFLAIKETLTHPWFFEARRISPFSGRGHDVDVVLDLMIHDIDIIAHLVGRPLKRVEAVGIPVLTGSVDIANARLTFEGGCVANVSASRAAFKGERTIRIFQPDQYVSLDFGKKKLKMYRKTSKNDSNGFPTISIDERKVEDGDALDAEIHSFLAAVATRSEPVVTGEDGLRALELVEQIKEGFRQSYAEFDAPAEILKKVGNFSG